MYIYIHIPVSSLLLYYYKYKDMTSAHIGFSQTRSKIPIWLDNLEPATSLMHF